jgi:hypothetical protein
MRNAVLLKVLSGITHKNKSGNPLLIEIFVKRFLNNTSR